MDKREFVRHIKELLELDSFKAIGVGAGSVSLVRYNEEIIISYNKYPGEYMLPPGLSGYKTFPEVESIIAKYFRKYNIGLSGYTIYHQSRREEDLDKRTIVNLEDFSKILPELHAMVYEDILPFFEKYKTIKDVHKELTTYGNDFDKINRFLFTPQPIRRMIIKRLFSDSDWDEFAMNLTDSIVARSKQDPNSQIAVYAKFLPDLYEELKGMQPLSQS